MRLGPPFPFTRQELGAEPLKFTKSQNKTRDGEKEIVLFRNLPSEVTAAEIAEAYRNRWSVESAFGEIRRYLSGEINALGYPKAALFSFAMALVSFNVLSIIANAIGGTHGEAAQQTFSTQQAAEEIHVVWSMTMIINLTDWQKHYANTTSTQVATELKRLAALVKLSRYKKQISKRRSPPRKRKSDAGSPHVATARLLDQRN